MTKVNDKSSILYRLRQQARVASLRPRTQDAVNFYLKTVRRLRTPLRKSPGFSNDMSLSKINSVRPGMLIYYEYDAITKNLPYFDVFPLTLVIETWTDRETGKSYFDGLNFHYLPPFMRFTLMLKLMNYTTINPNLKNSKVDINYGMLRGSSELSQFKPAYKKYLLTQVRSPFYQVELKYLDIAMSLPLANWSNGVGNQKVWSDSIAQSIRNMR